MTGRHAGEPEWLTDGVGRPLYLRVGDWDRDRPWSYDHVLGERQSGLSDDSLPEYLVTGRFVGQCHDGEPLLDQVEAVGMREPGPVPKDGAAP